MRPYQLIWPPFKFEVSVKSSFPPLVLSSADRFFFCALNAPLLLRIPNSELIMHKLLELRHCLCFFFPCFRTQTHAHQLMLQCIFLILHGLRCWVLLMGNGNFKLQQYWNTVRQKSGCSSCPCDASTLQFSLV